MGGEGAIKVPNAKSWNVNLRKIITRKVNLQNVKTWTSNRK